MNKKKISYHKMNNKSYNIKDFGIRLKIVLNMWILNAFRNFFWSLFFIYKIYIYNIFIYISNAEELNVSMNNDNNKKEIL
jgi:hypothetical protein